MDAIGTRLAMLLGLAKSGRRDRRRKPSLWGSVNLETLELREVPATIGPLPNVSVPANTGMPITLVGGTNPQSYTVTSTNPSIAASMIVGQFLTFNITHNSSGPGDPQITNQTMTYQLFDQLTPITTSKIKQLVGTDFYTGKVFHRIASGFADANGFIEQGGSVNGDGTGEVPLPGFPFQDEFVQSLVFDSKYQLAMANAGPDTNSSQFFATTGQPQFLNYKHTIFAQLVDGSSLVDQLTTIALNGTTPVNPVTINSATITNQNNNAVIMISAPTAVTGQTSTVTVNATDLVDGSTTSQTFTVNMVNSPVVNKPFLAPVTLQPNYPLNPVTSSFTLSAGNPQVGTTYNYIVAKGVQFNPSTGQQEFTPVTDATVNINQATGVVQITPNAGFTGPMNLVVGIRDQVDRTGTGNLDNPGNFDQQKITMTFSANAPTVPVAVPQTVDRATQPGNVSIQLVGQPGDPTVPTTLTYDLKTSPTHGTLLNFDPVKGTVIYRPDATYIGSDTFQFAVTDSAGLTSLPATVTILGPAGDTRSVRVQNGLLIVTPPPFKQNNTVYIQAVDNVLRVIVNGKIDSQQPIASNIRRIILFGSKRNDTLAIDPAITIPSSINGGMGGQNHLRAGGGASIMQGWWGKFNTMKGSPQKDQLIGTAGRTHFVKTVGNDTMFTGDPTAALHGPKGTFYKWVNNRLVAIPAPKPLPKFKKR